MPRAFEVEWQFAVRDVDAVARWLARTDLGPTWSVERRETLRLHDVYLDTADWDVARTGHALRIRTGDGRITATMKAFGGRGGGPAARAGAPARRRELEERLTAATPSAIGSTRGAVGRAVRRAVGAAPLRRLFTVRTRRDVWDVRRDGRTIAELALDRTRVTARGRARVLQRLEVEVGRGTPRDVARFVATLRRGRHLVPVRRSKFATGLAVAGLAPPLPR